MNMSGFRRIYPTDNTERQNEICQIFKTAEIIWEKKTGTAKSLPRNRSNSKDETSIKENSNDVKNKSEFIIEKKNNLKERKSSTCSAPCKTKQVARPTLRTASRCHRRASIAATHRINKALAGSSDSMTYSTVRIPCVPVVFNDGIRHDSAGFDGALQVLSLKESHSSRNNFK